MNLYLDLVRAAWRRASRIEIESVRADELAPGDIAFGAFVLHVRATTHGDGRLLLVTLSDRKLPMMVAADRLIPIPRPYLIQERP